MDGRWPTEACSLWPMSPVGSARPRHATVFAVSDTVPPKSQRRVGRHVKIIAAVTCHKVTSQASTSPVADGIRDLEAPQREPPTTECLLIFFLYLSRDRRSRLDPGKGTAGSQGIVACR